MIMVGGTKIGGEESVFWDNDQAVRMAKAELQHQVDELIRYHYDGSMDWWNMVEIPDPDLYFKTKFWDINIWEENFGHDKKNVMRVSAYPLEAEPNGHLYNSMSVWINLEYRI
jgi:hypothetical protein